MTYFQLVLARKGSPGKVSIAQKGIGILTQFNPAPAISAKSFSVYIIRRDKHLRGNKSFVLTMNVL
jgi:hypothetical protein